MRSKLFIIIASLALLTGCFGSTTPTTEKAAEGFHYYATDTFRIQIPDEWEVVRPEMFKSDVPKNTLSAFRSNLRNARFTANVAVIVNDAPKDVVSLDYAKALYTKVQDVLNDAKEVSVETIKIPVNGAATETLFTVNEGRETSSADLKRFFSVSGVKGEKAYAAVGSMLPSEGDATAKKLETIVRSFEVK